MSKPTRLDDCQYLLSTPINYTLTHFADPCETFSVDDSNATRPYQRIDSLSWTATEQQSGKRIKIRVFRNIIR